MEEERETEKREAKDSKEKQKRERNQTKAKQLTSLFAGLGHFSSLIKNLGHHRAKTIPNL